MRRFLQSKDGIRTVRKVWAQLGRFTESREDTRSVRRMQGDIGSVRMVLVTLGRRCEETNKNKNQERRNLP